MTAAIAAPLRTADWHEARRTGVGGSDIPILAGLSPYDRGPHDLYLEKTGQIEPSESTPAMEVGQVIEDAIAVLYARRTGRQVVRSNVLVRHPDYPWAMGNVDRKVRGERRLLEIKNRRALARSEGLPADIECQVQWYLGVTRYPVADVAILVGGNDLRIVEVEKDEAYFRDLLVIGGAFWRRVERREPPQIDGSASAARYLAQKYPWHQRDADLIPADADLAALAEELRDAQAAAKAAIGRAASIENAIKALLGEAPGVQGDNWRITWRRSADYKRTDWHAVADEFKYEAGGYTAAVEAHTATVEGSRRFVATFEGDTSG